MGEILELCWGARKDTDSQKHLKVGNRILFALLTKGIGPEMARLTLARKIAIIVLIVWKRGACFNI
jgi:hypothetical protein